MSWKLSALALVCCPLFAQEGGHPAPAKKDEAAKEAAKESEAKKPEGLSDEEWDLVQKFRKAPESARAQITRVIDMLANMPQMPGGMEQMPQGQGVQRGMRRGGQQRMVRPAQPKNGGQEEGQEEKK